LQTWLPSGSGLASWLAKPRTVVRLVAAAVVAVVIVAIVVVAVAVEAVAVVADVAMVASDRGACSLGRGYRCYCCRHLGHLPRGREEWVI
jgi:hypothetical protein